MDSNPSGATPTNPAQARAGTAEEPAEPDSDSPVRAPDPDDIRFVERTLASGVEMERSEPADGERQTPPDPASDVPGLKLLTSIMKATLFTDLFRYHADIRYMHRTQQERFEAHVKEYGRFYKFCRNSDYIARAVILLLIVFILGAAGVGTVLGTFFDWKD